MQLWAIEFVSLVSVTTQYLVSATKEAMPYAAEKVMTADLASRSSSCVTCFTVFIPHVYGSLWR